MKKVGLVIFLFVMHAASATARGSTTVVYPTGSYPTDVQNIQAAADLGGTVLLKAVNVSGVPTAFDFGPAVVGSGFVELQRDVEIVGESGSAMTTISGGHAPIRSFSPIIAAVRGIAFVAPVQYALFFAGGPDAVTEVTGNHVSHVVGRFFPSDGSTFAIAINVEGGAVVKFNVVDNIDAELSFGIEQALASRPVEVVGNRITGVNGLGIECAANADIVVISENIVHPGPERYPNFSFGAGIQIDGTGAYYVARNDVLVENANGTGIVALGFELFGVGAVTGAVIENNHVAVRLGLGAIDLAGLVFDSYVGQNKLEGVSRDTVFALYGLEVPGETSEIGFNTLVGNDIAQLRSDFADVYLDPVVHDTVLKGRSSTVVDLGTNNRITGFTKSAQSGSGRQVSKAMLLRRLAAQRAHHAAPSP